MRCPDCSKFVSMDNADPEVNNVEARYGSGTIFVEVDCRAVRACADCGTELKSLDLTLDAEKDLADFEGYKELSADEVAELQQLLEDGSIEIETDEGDSETNESGGGRYAKNMIETRCSVDLTIEWTNATNEEKKLTASVDVINTSAASEFEECC